MILTLTLSPTIDKTTTVNSIVSEKKLRCSEPFIEAGGGGINVSKAITELGGATHALFPAGGHNGPQLKELVLNQGISCTAVPTWGNTRETFIVEELSSGKEYKFVMPPVPLAQDELDAFLENLDNLITAHIDFLVLSGSIPDSVPESFIPRLCQKLTKTSIKLVVDTSGKPLKQALSLGAYLVKPNLSELAFLAGTDYITKEQITSVARAVMQHSNSTNIVVSLGPQGAILANRSGIALFNAPEIEKMSTVGAGDSMLGGILFMLDQQATIEDSVRFGVACGSAATICKQSSIFRKQDAWHLYETLKSEQTIHISPVS